MNTSRKPAERPRRNNGWLRRAHRWLGVGLAVFVLLLATTGIALNHSDDWNLGKHYVRSSWLLDAYGIRAPSTAASFTDRSHHAALLGQRLYFDAREVAADVNVLTGLVITGELALLTTDDHAFVLTVDGELVEQLDLASALPGKIARAGRVLDRAVIVAAGSRYRSNRDMTRFDPWQSPEAPGIEWSTQAALPASLLASLQEQYRGHGLSVERVLADIHSGRIVGPLAKFFMDVVAVLLIVLSGSGIILWLRRAGQRNGRGSYRA